MAISFRALPRVPIEIPTVAPLPRNDSSARRGRIYPARTLSMTALYRFKLPARRFVQISARSVNAVQREGHDPPLRPGTKGFSFISDRSGIETYRAGYIRPLQPKMLGFPQLSNGFVDETWAAERWVAGNFSTPRSRLRRDSGIKV